MATEQIQNQFENGPFVTMACICERALREDDGVLSVIRVVDRFIVTGAGPDAPTEMPPHDREYTIVVMVKSGVYKGSAEIRVVPEHPSGIKGEGVSASFHLEGDERGHQMRFMVRDRFEESGLYWYHVYLNDVEVTRIPLRLMYQRVSTPGR